MVKERILKSVGRRRLIMYRESRPLQLLSKFFLYETYAITPSQVSVTECHSSCSMPHTILCLSSVNYVPKRALMHDLLTQ